MCVSAETGVYRDNKGGDNFQKKQRHNQFYNIIIIQLGVPVWRGGEKVDYIF